MTSYILGLAATIGDLIRRRQADRNFWLNQQLEFKRMAKPTLRDLVGKAIFDPGAVIGFKGGRTLTGWQTDAVMQILSDATIDDPALQHFIGIRDAVTGCSHPENCVAIYKDPGDIQPHLLCVNCGAKFLDRTSLEAARRKGEGVERRVPFPKLDQALLDSITLIQQARQDVADLMRVDLSDPLSPAGLGLGPNVGSIPEPESTATGARATGWKISHTGMESHQGYHYAEGPGDLRIRTNDRPLLDRILHSLAVDEEMADRAAAIRFMTDLPASVAADDIERAAKRAGLDTSGMERICAKAGVDLGGNKLPERDQAKPAEAQGLFRKFDVRRVDGSDAPGAKHDGCRYFVLDVDHDPHSVPALVAYAAAVEATHPQLAKDLRSEWQIPKPVLPEPKHMTAADCIDWSKPDQIHYVPGHLPAGVFFRGRDTGSIFLRSGGQYVVVDGRGMFAGKEGAMLHRRDVMAGSGIEPIGTRLGSLQPADDAAMMKESEEYVANRTPALGLTENHVPPRRYYDAAQLRAAFRSGYDYARRK